MSCLVKQSNIFLYSSLFTQHINTHLTVLIGRAPPCRLRISRIENYAVQMYINKRVGQDQPVQN